MKKELLWVVLLILVISFVNASSTETSVPMGAEVEIVEPIVEDANVIYSFDEDSGFGRNSLFPGREYAFTGEIVHVEFLISEEILTYLDTEQVKVRFTRDDGYDERTMSLEKISVTSYNPSTGRYEAWFGIDYEMPLDMVGVYFISVKVENEVGGMVIDNLDDSNYMSMNDLVANPVLEINTDAELSFTLSANQYNRAFPWPLQYAIFSPHVDREGQGVIGNFSVAATNLESNTNPIDIIEADDIRFRESPSDPWKHFMSNDPYQEPENWFGLDSMLDLNGVYPVGATENKKIFVELWFDADHSAIQFPNGGELWFKYEVY